MKILTKYLIVSLLCMCTVFTLAQEHHETFETANCPLSVHGVGVFKSSSTNYWWKYRSCILATTSDQINGKSIELKSFNGSITSSQIKGGVSYLSFTVNNPTATAEERILRIEILPQNGNATELRTVSFAGNMVGTQQITVEDLAVPGLVKIKITNRTPSSPLVIDDVKWGSQNLINETYTTQILSDYESNPATSRLYDFSYAGYKNRDEEIPDVPVVSNVTDFGAIADDAQDDTPAFQAAINDASSKGGGAVLIPPGKYLLNAGTTPDQFLTIPDKVVLRGSGSATDGTILFLSKYINATNGQGVLFGSRVTEADYRVKGNIGVVEDAQKGSHYLKLTSTNNISAGSQIRIVMRQSQIGGVNQDDLSRALSYPLLPEPEWTNYKRAYAFRCYMEVEAVIDATTIRLKQPLIRDIQLTHRPFIDVVQFTEGIGIENLRLESNFQGGYKHHGSWEFDYGWCGIGFSYVKDSWIRNVVIKDMVWDINISNAMNVTVENVIIEGQSGHHGVKFSESTFCLAKDIYFDAARTHLVGASNCAHANVFTRIGSHYPNGMIDHHGAGPASHNLYELINDVHSDSGGAIANMPHSGQNNVFWNLIGNVSQGNEKPGLDFFSGFWNYPSQLNGAPPSHECYKLYPQSVLAGVYHTDHQIEVNHSTSDRSDEWITIEGFNQEGISPASLYEYQRLKRNNVLSIVWPETKIPLKKNPDESRWLRGGGQSFIYNMDLGKCQIAAYNLSGAKVLNYQDYVKEGGNMPYSLEPGFYIMVAEGLTKVVVQKVMVNH